MVDNLNQIKAVVFDMGNVVLKVDHMIACKKFSRFSDLSKEDIFKKIIGSSLEDSLERGLISPESFYESISKKIGVDISFDDFSNIYNDVFSTNDGMSEIIFELKDKVKIMLLSNTNELHFSWVDKKFSVLKNFNQRVLSYKIGARKPEKEIFLHALDVLDLMPKETVYVDDLEEFVKASGKLGMNSILFKSPSAFRSELLKYF
jgi:HAD superfamily hydrolase (TIGR01509 family)